MTMRRVELLRGEVRVAGIVDVEETDDGLVLHRMPTWARGEHNDITLNVLETMPCGARLEFATEATEIEIDAQLTLIQMGEEPVRPAVFDLVVDGELVDGQPTTEGTRVVIDPEATSFGFVPGGPTTIRFRLANGHKGVQIWLPQSAVVTILELRANGVVTAAPSDAPRWVHYGSSISQCGEADRPTGTWTAVAARRAGVDLQSFAFAGQCHIDPFAARMIADQPADVISLKLGINVLNADTLRERAFVPAVHGFLDTVRIAHPSKPLLVITPITCPVAEDHPGPTLTVDGQCTVVPRSPELAVGALTLGRIRELLREVVQRRKPADPNLYLLEGPELFGPEDVHDLPDGLHPNAAGYQRMGERFFDLAFSPGRPFYLG